MIIMKPNSNLIISNNFCFILFPRLFINLIFLALQKRAPKLCYFDGRAPQLSARVTLVPPGAGVVCQF